MSNKTYEARVRKIAEEFMMENNPLIELLKGHAEKSDGWWKYENELEIYMPAARIAVKHMADEFSQGYEAAVQMFGFELDDHGYAISLKDELVSRGLIPSPEQWKEAGEEKPKCEACGSEYGAKWSDRGSATLCPTCNSEI
jgi:hypothetical protein